MNYILNVIRKNKVTKETFWAAIAKTISVFSGVVIVVVIPRLAGIEVYGEFSLLMAYVSILGLFYGTPIHAAVTKELTEGVYNSRSRDFFLAGLRLKIFLSIVSSIVFLFFLGLTDIQIFKQHSILFVLLISIMNIWGLIVTFFESVHRLFYEAVLYFIEYTTKLIIIFFFFRNLSVDKLLIAFIAGYFFATVIGLVLIFYKFGDITLRVLLRVDTENLKTILNRTFYLLMASAFMVILSKTDVIMISSLLGFKEVGFYSIAADITQQATIVSMPIILGVTPLFVKKDFKDIFIKSLKELIFINTLLFIGLVLFSGLFVEVVYGEGYETVTRLIRILGIFPMLISLQSLFRGILTLKDKTKQIFLFGFLAAILNIVLNYILIMQHGVFGAAVSTIISYILLISLSFWYLVNHSS